MEPKKIILVSAALIAAIVVYTKSRSVRHAVPIGVPASQTGITSAPERATATGSFQRREQEAARVQSEIRQLPVHNEIAFQRRLSLYKTYARKVLKTETERRVYEELLADEETQKEALEHLRPQTPENGRMLLVEYLIDAMDAQKKLGRSSLREAVAAFLQTPVPGSRVDKAQLQSLAADRIELFATLKQIDPQAAERLMIAPSDSLNKRIYQYAMANYGHNGG